MSSRFTHRAFAVKLFHHSLSNVPSSLHFHTTTIISDLFKLFFPPLIAIFIRVYGWLSQTHTNRFLFRFSEPDTYASARISEGKIHSKHKVRWGKGGASMVSFSIGEFKTPPFSFHTQTKTKNVINFSNLRWT